MGRTRTTKAPGAKKTWTLRELSKMSGISYASVQKAFDDPEAPSRNKAPEELVQYLRNRLAGTVELPPDLAQRLVLIKYNTAKERENKEREAAEKLRLQNLEKKGKLIERDMVRAEGAAIGLALSATLSGWAKDLPAELLGKSELELTRTIQDRVDKLIAEIRRKLAE